MFNSVLSVVFPVIAAAQTQNNGNVFFSLLFFLVLIAMVALWIANIFGLVRAVRTDITSRIVLHAVGTVTCLLGSVMGAIYFFKWRQEPFVVRASKKSAGGVINVADELSKLASLRDQGVITTADLEAQKRKLLNP
jgi:hypothetical protein